MGSLIGKELHLHPHHSKYLKFLLPQGLLTHLFVPFICNLLPFLYHLNSYLLKSKPTIPLLMSLISHNNLIVLFSSIGNAFEKKVLSLVLLMNWLWTYAASQFPILEVYHQLHLQSIYNVIVANSFISGLEPYLKLCLACIRSLCFHLYGNCVDQRLACCDRV